jgi:hypothetical protein
MAVFVDAEEIYRYIGGMLEEAVADPVVGTRLAGYGVVLRVHYTDPTATMTVDLPARRVLYGDTGSAPDVELFMTGDFAHRLWLGRARLARALLRGDLRARGAFTAIRLSSLSKSLAPVYRALLEDAGRPDLVAAA